MFAKNELNFVELFVCRSSVMFLQRA